MFGGCLFGSCNLCYLQLGRCVNQALRQLLDIMANKKWSRKSKMSNWPSTEWVWRTNLELMSNSRTEVIENKYKKCYLCSELFLDLNFVMKENWIKRVTVCAVKYITSKVVLLFSNILERPSGKWLEQEDKQEWAAQSRRPANVAGWTRDREAKMSFLLLNVIRGQEELKQATDLSLFILGLTFPSLPL